MNKIKELIVFRIERWQVPTFIEPIIMGDSSELVAKQVDWLHNFLCKARIWSLLLLKICR